MPPVHFWPIVLVHAAGLSRWPGPAAYAGMRGLRWGFGFRWIRGGLPLPGPILVTRLWILFRGLGGSLRFLSLEFEAIQLSLGKVQHHGVGVSASPYSS